MADLDAKVNLLSQALATNAAHRAPAPAASTLVPGMDKYASDTSQCKGFLLQCSLYFAGHKELSKRQNIAQFLGLLNEKALKWARAV